MVTKAFLTKQNHTYANFVLSHTLWCTWELLDEGTFHAVYTSS